MQTVLEYYRSSTNRTINKHIWLSLGIDLSRSWLANVVTDLMTRKLGLVREVHCNWPDPLSNLLGYNGQQLVLQDCLYRSSLSWWWWWKCFRNRDGFKYLAFSDLDERLLPGHLLFYYSLVGLVWPNTEELISRPFMGLWKIWLLLQDRMRTKNLRN